MITETINGITRLTADKGKVLIRGDVQGTEVWLSPNESAANWTESAPPTPLTPLKELSLVRAQLTAYKTAVAEVAALNTTIALKADLIGAITRLKAAVAEQVKVVPVVAEPIVPNVRGL